MGRFNPFDVFVKRALESKRRTKTNRFNAKTKDNYRGPVIVAEGDSWFEYPWQNDILMVLSNKYKILSLARAGDTWPAVLHEKELFPSITSVKPDIVLLSVGGNDIIDGLLKYVRPFTLGRERSAKAYVDVDAFGTDLDLVFQHYDTVARQIVDLDIDVVVSGYDYPNPRPADEGGQWIGGPLSLYRKINDRPLWHEITKLLMDIYVERMTSFAAAFNEQTTKGGSPVRFEFVSQIGAVNNGSYAPHPGMQNDEWNDEMHARDPGFERLAGRVAAAIDRIWARRTAPIV